MPELAEIKTKEEELAKTAKEIRRLALLQNDDSHDWTPEEEENWNACNADFDRQKRALDAHRRVVEVEKDFGDQPADTEQTRALVRGAGRAAGRAPPPGDPFARDLRETHELRQASIRANVYSLQAWCLHSAGLDDKITDEHRAAMRFLEKRYQPGKGLSGEFPRCNWRTHRDRLLAEARATMTTGTDAELIDESWERTLEKTMLYFGPMWQVCRVISTERGGDHHMPKMDDTTNEGIEVAEAAPVGDQEATSTETILGAIKYTSLMIKVTPELLEDNPYDLATVLAEFIGERLGRITNRRFTTGTGAGLQPEGIVPNATTILGGGAAGTMLATDWMDLEHAVDIAYRTGAAFMCHDSIELAIRKLQDLNGQFLWQPGLQLGTPNRLLGYPLHINNHMAATIANAAIIGLFGRFNSYAIRRVRGVRMSHLVERYADTDEQAFVGFMRVDGKLHQSAGIRSLTVPSV